MSSSAQNQRKNPNRPTVVRGTSGTWLARAYDANGRFQVAAEHTLPDAYNVAVRFAAGDYSGAWK